MKKTISSTPVKKSTRDLERFLLWFLDQPELPMETKQAFVEHLLEVRCFDDVAQEYVAIIMQVLILSSAEKAEQTKLNLERIKDALAEEKNPETSLCTHITTAAGKKMKALAESFVLALKSYDKNLTLHSEAIQHGFDSQSITSLKKNIS